VKHLDADAIAYAHSLIVESALDVEPEMVAASLGHLDWVLEQNRTLNLTAIVDPLEAVRLHVIDSLMALPEVSAAPEGSMIDIGSGAGFPGIELALATHRETLLVESVRKKAVAVERYLLQENLESWISVSGLRAEELALTSGASAAVVTARALSSLPSLVELAAPLLRYGGRLVALKGRPEADEITRGKAAATVCGLTMESMRELSLPGGGENRTIVVFVRTGTPSVKLPRRVGLAQRHPLA